MKKDKIITFKVEKDFESPITKGKMLKEGMTGEMRQSLLEGNIDNVKILNREVYNEQKGKQLKKVKDNG